MFKRILLVGTALMMLCSSVYGADRVVLQNGDGNEIGTTANPMKITLSGSAGSYPVTSAGWVGLSATAGRIVFTDTTVDLLNFLTSAVKIGAGIPTITQADDDLYVTGKIELDGSLYTALTATRVPYTTTNGQLTDSANLTFDGTTVSLGVSNIASVVPTTGKWTVTNGWNTTPPAYLTREDSGATGTATPKIGAQYEAIPTIGVTYRIVIVCSAKAGGNITYTYGGVAGTPITATTITDTITATTTGKMIITGVANATCTIDSITITPIGNLTATGTVTGRQLTSTIETGTAPLTVASTTQVANLNAATAGNAATVTTNANLTGDVTSVGNATTQVKWDTGNVTYVPAGDGVNDEVLLNAYILASADGDTLILAGGPNSIGGANTYVLGAGVTVNKKLHVMGQGEGITTITCSTDNVPMITLANAGSMLSDVTISKSGAMTTGSLAHVVVTASAVIENVEILDTTMGGAIALNLVSVSAGTLSLNNCYLSSSGVMEYHSLVVTSGTGVVNMRNCYLTDLNSATASMCVQCTAGTINIYDSTLVSDDGSTTYGVVYASGGAINVYNSTLSGGVNDVKNAGGTITLYDTTLVNNTTSGTITYGGTVHTKGLKVNTGTASVNTNSTTALLVEQPVVAPNVLHVDTTNGQVGVYTSPTGSYSRFVVGGEANSITMLGATSVRLLMGTSLGTVNEYRGVIDYVFGTAIMDFWTGGASRMQLSNTGLGIGCTPATALDIDSNSNTQNTRIRGLDAAKEYADLYCNSIGAFVIKSFAAADAGKYSFTAISQSTSNAGGQYGLVMYPAGTDSGGYYANFWYNSTGTDYLNMTINQGNESGYGLTVNESQQVGVGCVAATAGMDIDSNSNSACLRLRGAAEASEYADFYVDAANDLYVDSTNNTYLADPITFAKDFQPETDNTYYLGKNDDDTPKAWKGVILKDTTNGKYYRIEIISGTITATDLTD